MFTTRTPLALLALALSTTLSTAQVSSSSSSSTSSMTSSMSSSLSSSSTASTGGTSTITSHPTVAPTSATVQSSTPPWTTGASLLEVPTSILYPPGSNTVTPWAVTPASYPVSDFSDVLNPGGYPTPGPYDGTLSPNLVGNGSKKDISYGISVGAIAGVVVGAVLLMAVAAGAGWWLLWKRKRSVHLGRGSVGMGLGNTMGKKVGGQGEEREMGHLR